MRTSSSGRSTVFTQDFVTTPEGLKAFAEKVEALKSEGLNQRLISERLGVAYSTITCRLAKWKKINEKTAHLGRRSRAGEATT